MNRANTSESATAMMPTRPAICDPPRDVLGGETPDRHDRQHDERSDEHDVDECDPVVHALALPRRRPRWRTPYALAHLGQTHRRVQAPRGNVLFLRAQRDRVRAGIVRPLRDLKDQRSSQPAAPALRALRPAARALQRPGSRWPEYSR